MKLLLKKHFPNFAKNLKKGDLSQVLKGISLGEIEHIEKSLGIPLPASYKKFISLCRGFYLFGGPVQFSSGHPFPHDFPEYEKLSKVQQDVVRQRGGIWPPPSNGMLCFAEYFWKADGDQVLFQIDRGLINGEYPVFYYSHESSPASVTKMSDSFGDWLENHCIQDMKSG